MSFTNHIVVDGNLVRDGEVKFLPSGICILNFTVAHNTKRDEKEEVHYFDCAAFGKYAEMLVPSMSKGTPVLIVGKLQQRRWEGKDGAKKTAINIFVTQVMFGQGTKKAEAAVATDKEMPADDLPF